MNTHGWSPLAGATGSISFTEGTRATVSAVRFGPIVEDRKRCACPTISGCCRPATAEDLLCDECRAECG